MKLYPKLDSYMIDMGAEIYLGSSNQFKTQKAYKAWLLAQPKWAHLTIKIKRG